MGDDNRIGDYLRARRALVRPDEVGLPVADRRRVPGLRREELALLAGVSASYYVRLEQGRDQHPSPQVLDALARVLRLDEDATAYLHGLAHPEPVRARVPRDPRTERVSPGILQLIDSWPRTPALVHGRLLDVLAVNPLAAALTPIYRPGVNSVRATFLDAAVRRLFGADWPRIAESTVSGLRPGAGSDAADPELAAMVADLSARSPEFRELWARHDVRPRAGGGISHLDHPLVGPLALRFEKLAITGADGQTLVLYHAEPGSPSAHALDRLAAAPARPSDEARPRASASAPVRPARR